MALLGRIVRCRTIPCADLGFMSFLKLLSLGFILNSVAASLPKMSLSKHRKVDKEYAEFSKTFGPFPAFLRR